MIDVYLGSLDFYQNQLTAAGIPKEKVDLENYRGLSEKQIQETVDIAIKFKRIKEMKICSVSLT